MSRPDLARTLREARPVAPAELRERVRLVAAEASPPRRQLVTWRRALVLVVVVGTAVAAGVIATRPSHHAASQELQAMRPTQRHAAVGSAASVDKLGAPSATPPSPSRTRLQNYSASLDVRVPTAGAVSTDTQHAIAIATSLGGYLAFVNVDAGGKTGDAEIRLRIPKVHVQEAVRRLSALGRVVGENVRIQDLTAGVNATDRLIARLQTKLATLRAEFQTTLVQRQIASLTTQIERLQRGRANTMRTASYATVVLSLQHAPHHTRRPAPSRPAARARHGVSLDRDRRGLRPCDRRAAARARRADLARRRRDPPPARRRLAQPPLIWANTRKVGSPTGSSPNSGLMQGARSERDS
jgi:hypothetical protein